MSHRTQNTLTRPTDLPPGPGISQSQRESRRSKVLVALHKARGRALCAKQIKSLSGFIFSISGAELERGVLGAMEVSGLVTRHEPVGDESVPTWTLTEHGRMLALELTDTPQAPGANVAGPRNVRSNQPMPRGEFRVMRAGAYDYEGCPSIINGRRVWRDGRVKEETA